MTHFLQSRSQRAVAVFMALAIVAVAASALMLFDQSAEAVPPPAGMSQAVSDYNDDILFRHGVQAWHEKGYNGSYHDGSKTVRLKVGIIDTGFDGWRMSSLQGMLPTPPDLDEDDNARVKTKCYIKTSNGAWESSDFEGCEAPNHDKASDNTHGTSVAETIYAIAPEAEFYISNAPYGSEQRKAIEWMESEGVVVINRSLHGNFRAPGDGNPYAGSSDSDIHILRKIMQKSESEVLFVNSAGNHGRFTWYGPYADSNSNRKVDMRVYSSSVRDYNYIELAQGDEIRLEARWKDTWGTKRTAGATCDLDLVLERTNGSIKYESTATQAGGNGEIPYEAINEEITNAGWYRISLEHEANECNDQPDWIQMRIVGAGSDKKFHYATTEGSVGQATNDAHYQMASVQEATFNNASTDADYLVVAGSEPDFTKTTASNYGPTLGDNRQRPDIAASWCSNYNHAAGGIFCGTSQSAPVVSGLAVLIKEDDTTRTGKQIAAYLRDEADHANSGYDYGMGHGVAFLDGAALLEKYSGLPPAAIGINQTRTFRVLFPDVDSSSGVKVTVGSNLSLNGNCTSGRLTQDTVDYGDEIDIKGCSTGESTVKLNHATDNAVEYRSYAMTVNQYTAFRCDRGRGTVANSSNLTWTNGWYDYCDALGPGGSGISRYNSFSTPGSDYIKYKFVMPLSTNDNLRLWHGSTPPRRMHPVLDEKRGVDTTSGVIERVLPSGQHFTLESNAASGTTGSHQVTVTSTSASTAPSLRVNVGDCTIAKDCIKVSWTPVDGINDYEIKWRASGSSTYLGTRILDAVDPATNSTQEFHPR